MAEQNGQEQPEEEVVVSNTILVAADTEYERELTLTLPRGKAARGKTPKIIESIAGMDVLIDEGGNVNVGDLGKAMSIMFDTPGFVETLAPLALGLINPKNGKMTKDDEEWYHSLTDMDLFQAYIQAAVYIATNGAMQKQVDHALKK